MALNTDFALEGFRIIRERPQLILYWVCLALLKFGGGMLAMSFFAGSELMEWQNLMPQAAEKARDPAFMERVTLLMQTIGPTSLGVFLGWQLIDGVLYTAIIRAVNKSVPYRFGYLTFGAEVWRTALVSLLTYFILLVVLIGLMFAGLLLSSLLAFEQGLMVISEFVCLLGGAFATLWAFVRLSLNWAASADKRRIAIDEGLSLTRGKTWPLFGGYVLSLMLSLAVGFLVQLILALIILGIKGEGLSQLGSVFNPDFTTPQTLLTLDSLVFILASACMWPLSASLMMGATAAAYNQLKKPA